MIGSPSGDHYSAHWSKPDYWPKGKYYNSQLDDEILSLITEFSEFLFQSLYCTEVALKLQLELLAMESLLLDFLVQLLVELLLDVLNHFLYHRHFYEDGLLRLLGSHYHSLSPYFFRDLLDDLNHFLHWFVLYNHFLFLYNSIDVFYYLVLNHLLHRDLHVSHILNGPPLLLLLRLQFLQLLYLPLELFDGF